MVVIWRQNSIAGTDLVTFCQCDDELSPTILFFIPLIPYIWNLHLNLFTVIQLHGLLVYLTAVFDVFQVLKVK